MFSDLSFDSLKYQSPNGVVNSKDEFEPSGNYDSWSMIYCAVVQFILEWMKMCFWISFLWSTCWPRLNNRFEHIFVHFLRYFIVTKTELSAMWRTAWFLVEAKRSICLGIVIGDLKAYCIFQNRPNKKILNGKE